MTDNLYIFYKTWYCNTFSGNVEANNILFDDQISACNVLIMYGPVIVRCNWWRGGGVEKEGVCRDNALRPSDAGGVGFRSDCRGLSGLSGMLLQRTKVMTVVNLQRQNSHKCKSLNVELPVTERTAKNRKGIQFFISSWLVQLRGEKDAS